MEYSLHGRWTADIGDGKIYPIKLPGTLDENQIGHRDTGANQWHPDAALGNENQVFQSEAIATRFTRNYTYEGEARFTRQVDRELWSALEGEIREGKRIFLEAERARVLRLRVDGREVPDFVEPSISTRHVFEVTGLIREESELTLCSDNSYPGLPHDDIVFSSAATDETQTNWNGVLGYLRFRTEEQVFLDDIAVYPANKELTVKLRLYAGAPYEGSLRVSCGALSREAVRQVRVTEPVTEIVFEGLPLKEDARRWDLEEGNLYELSVSLAGNERKTVSFGVREFGDNGEGRLAVNGRVIFLRSEANCGEFPETGYPPMEVERWLEILKRYRSYGVNCVRFHSHCPPEAAFTAADQLGMLMQPELSHWNPRAAFETEESYGYYRTELTQILRMLANHPSFVMLTFGNELHATEKGHERMASLLELARRLDATRLYADASNGHYGMRGCDLSSDFYTASGFYEWDLRGTFANMRGYLNNAYPGAGQDYSSSMARLREEYGKPVFEFEVGQFEVLPDFDELEAFRGVSDPANLRLIRDRVEDRGLTAVWKQYVEATGELSRIGYREEIEASMRTEELSGISLLGLQDFPGQGTALVGMMNSHLEPKPYEFAKPEHFRSFFRDQLPLVLLPKYTWEVRERLTAQIKIGNFGKTEISGEVEYELREQRTDGRGYSQASEKEGTLLCRGTLPQVSCPPGRLTEGGRLEIELSRLSIQKPVRLNLIVSVGGFSNLYPVWIYPEVKPVCPENVYEARRLDERAKRVLAAGGRVYLSPPAAKEALPSSIKTQFTTDFWSVGTFAGQEGGMGQLIDVTHPIFEDFPTEFHTNWQWWPMATQRAVITPERWEAIVTELDSYAFLRPMVQLLECRCGGGRLLFSTLGLQDLGQYPEARALQDAIYRYMASDRFAPRQELDPEEIGSLVR